jgi:hypothetical protein
MLLFYCLTQLLINLKKLHSEFIATTVNNFIQVGIQLNNRNYIMFIMLIYSIKMAYIAAGGICAIVRDILRVALQS